MLIKYISNLHLLLRKLWSRILMYGYKELFFAAGNNVKFDPIFSRFSYRTISLGSNVFISSGAVFSADRSRIIIGSYVMFGPNVVVSGGDHDITQTDKPMFMVKDKAAACDADVVIEDDVWVGANSIILKGVTIGMGSIVAAGSIVTKNVDPFCIYAGAPARKIKERFTKVELSEYKKHLKSFGVDVT